MAALFAAASAAVAAVPDARKAAMRRTLDEAARAELDRYLSAAAVIETRWLVIRLLGIAGTAVLLWGLVPGAGVLRVLLALLGVLIAYGVPAEVLMAVGRNLAEPHVVRLLRMARPFELLVAPIAAPISLLGSFVSRLVKRPRAPSTSLAESEVEILVNEGEMNGALSHEESEMIRNVLDFGDIRAGDVMVPRTQVTALDIDKRPDELLKIIAETSHSRYPVYRERIDNVVGILHVKDLVAYAAEHDPKDMSVAELMRAPVAFVPETQLASAVLKDMRARRRHMAVIIDEFGGMSGIVTLEDLLEEIVGDIQDEHDRSQPPIVDLGDGRLLVDAGVSITDLSRYLGVELPEDANYNSLGGFIVERMGEVPEVGTTIDDQGLQFVVREADERRVCKVEIVRSAPSPDSLPPQSSRRSAAA